LVYFPPETRGDKIEIIIQKGSSSWQVAGQLADNGLVRNRCLFMLYSIIRGKFGALQAGRYMISPDMNIPTVLYIISNGLITSKDVSITIPEGINIAEIGEILEKVGLFKKANDFLTPETLNDEGFLFPDTYIINQGKSDGREEAYTREITQQVVSKMKNKFYETVGEFKIENQDKLKEIITIASILEKEVRSEKDMKLVAGIIKKRITLGMDLELDATVAYGACFGRAIEQSKKTEISSVSFCDVSKVSIVDNIHVDSLYNTYTRKGLPAGPISNPGLRAIKAAMNPQPSEYLYYLNARDGTTIYSKTGKEHEANRKKYIL
jgi:UPF0755 protein